MPSYQFEDFDMNSFPLLESSDSSPDLESCCSSTSSSQCNSPALHVTTTHQPLPVSLDQHSTTLDNLDRLNLESSLVYRSSPDSANTDHFDCSSKNQCSNSRCSCALQDRISSVGYTRTARSPASSLSLMPDRHIGPGCGLELFNKENERLCNTTTKNPHKSSSKSESFVSLFPPIATEQFSNNSFPLIPDYSIQNIPWTPPRTCVDELTQT